MENNEIDVLFPPRIIPQLMDLRGDVWRELVNEVLRLEPAAPQRLAFVIMMVRLGNCPSCHSDTYRAMRGCLACATQTVKRFRGSDTDFVRLYQDALLEIERYKKKIED